MFKKSKRQYYKLIGDKYQMSSNKIVFEHHTLMVYPNEEQNIRMRLFVASDCRMNLNKREKPEWGLKLTKNLLGNWNGLRWYLIRKYIKY